MAILHLYLFSDKDLPANVVNMFNEVASQMRGIASVVFVDCSYVFCFIQMFCVCFKQWSNEQTPKVGKLDPIAKVW